QLRFLIVRDDPDIGESYKGNDLRPWTHELTCSDLPLSHDTIGRRHNTGVTKIDARELQGSFLGGHIRLELFFLSIKNNHLLRWRSQRSLAVGELCAVASFVGHGLFKRLVRPRGGFPKGLLTAPF